MARNLPEPEVSHGRHSKTDVDKKHKKHKRHKHHKHVDGDDMDSNGKKLSAIMKHSQLKPTIKLKLKIGQKPSAASSLLDVGFSDDNVHHVAYTSEIVNSVQDMEEKQADSPQSDTSDEEREWLTALQDGTLDDNGDVKKNKDVSLLTTRQKALLHGNVMETLQQLPLGYKCNEVTGEQLERRIEKAKKRRQIAIEKREQDKKETVERLLTKQAAKVNKAKLGKKKKRQLPTLRYVNNNTGISISLPHGVQLAFASRPTDARPAPAQVLCGVDGCTNVKKYSCSRTGIPLCSLQCYNRNLLLKNIT